jgi:ubiquinone/menaquinone biosynthesis C-methylase UbiE
MFYNKLMFSDPNTIVQHLYIPIGASVADLGAGTGAYTLALSKKVGPEGKVYACDVQKDMLARLENEIKDHHITNVQTVLSNIESHQGTKLRDQSVDWVIIANVLFQVEDRDALIGEINRILKPAGSVLVVDWSESFGNLGPHEREVINALDAEKKFTTLGFKKTPQTIDAGSHHYGMVFKK